MLQPPIDIESLWRLPSDQFLPTCKKVFDWQVQNNPVYQQWVNLIAKDAKAPAEMNQIPF